MNAFMTILANASPLHYAANTAIIGIFQKTKVLQIIEAKYLVSISIQNTLHVVYRVLFPH
jgi:hypothetical protein